MKKIIMLGVLLLIFCSPIIVSSKTLLFEIKTDKTISTYMVSPTDTSMFVASIGDCIFDVSEHVRENSVFQKESFLTFSVEYYYLGVENETVHIQEIWNTSVGDLKKNREKILLFPINKPELFELWANCGGTTLNLHFLYQPNGTLIFCRTNHLNLKEDLEALKK